MNEYDVFLPLNFNDGSPIEAERFDHLQNELLDRFGGFTFFPQPNKGFWRHGDVTYRDEIVIYRVLAADRQEARSYFSLLKERLKTEFAQKEILIIEREIDTL